MPLTVFAATQPEHYLRLMNSRVPTTFRWQINIEASDEDSDKCPRCKARLVTTETHRQAEGDITHWSVVCESCGLTGVVWND